MLKEITMSALAQYNGKNGQPAYIAFKGKVYDVSGIFKNGEHAGVTAGIDITGILAKGPHSEDIFNNFQVIGTLI
jgi:putative oxidoreductase